MNFDFILKGVDSVTDFFDESYDYVMGQSDWINPDADIGDLPWKESKSLVESGFDAVKGLFGEDSGGTSGGVSKSRNNTTTPRARYMDQGDAMQFGSSVSSPNFKSSEYGYKESVNFMAIEQNWIERMRQFANLGEKVK